MIALSLLVCSVHTRRATFAPKIIEQIYGQWETLPEVDQQRVEILFLMDNKIIGLGEKRNMMVDMARGEYLEFVDDDDEIEPDLISSILAAIDEHHPDVVTFLAAVTINGGDPKPCVYSTRWKRDSNTASEYRRIPNHICAVRKEVARNASFPNVPKGEDSGFSKLLLPHLKTEHHIPRVLYRYAYSDETTETQVERPSMIRSRPLPPVVDVVILSNGSDRSLRAMTQTTIDSCLSGANSLPVNVIVVEARPNLAYRNAVTIPAPPGSFNYNRTANAGAEHGSAPWLMIANNDLKFEDGWLHALLAADHPIVSPHNPGDPRQADLEQNEVGRENGRHLSGWCYCLTRDLYRLIGGFDERVRFWCSDDAVLEQVVGAGYDPMIVPAARVKHLTSRTLRRAGRDHDELTWGQVRIFNRIYGRDKFGDDARYLRYLTRHPETVEAGL